MHSRLIISLLSLLLSASAAFAASAIPCKRITTNADAWVYRKVNAIVRSAHAAYEDERKDAALNKLVRGISQTIERCNLQQDARFASRHRKFLDYIDVSVVAQRPDHKLGFAVSDRQYFAETTRYVEIPEFLLTQRFLRLVSRYEFLPQAKAYLHELNQSRSPRDQLLFLSFRSQHLGTPDNPHSFERLLIVVPGNATEGVPEKWVQFGITDEGAPKLVRNLSIVSALRNPDGSSKIYFKDFYRTYAPNGSIKVKGRWELGHGEDNCVSCHKSGVLPIFPDKHSVSESEEPTLEAVNRRFLTYGPPRFQHYLDPRKLGPGLGSASKESRMKRFGTGPGERFDESRVGTAMSCGACHKPEWLGSLNWPMDSVLLSSFVEGGRMPLGHQLKRSERTALYKNLIEEYFAVEDTNPGILKSWLVGLTKD